MPYQNRFRHQHYQARDRTFERLNCPQPVAVESDEFQRRMVRVAESVEAAGISGVILIHGTFMGTDASGVIREIARVSPTIGVALRNLEKQAVDHVASDVGNYTREFAAILERALESHGRRRIPVRLFTWSGENHHIGRADGAVRLLHELAQHVTNAGSRWLVWAHSHGGNVLALVSNLLASDHATLRRFFHAARSYYRWPALRKVDIPVWPAVKTMLLQRQRPWDDMALDMVTFGAPVRYGWDSEGYANLLHFIHHRSPTGSLEVRFPPSMDDVLCAAGGDLLQQLGIAGTNFPPTMFAWRARLAEHRLSRLLQAGILRRDLLTRFRAGQRLHEDGQNLLVDYGSMDNASAQQFAGHSVYTRQQWLLFHAEEIATRLYGMA